MSMKNDPDISVCIANWNCRELLRVCLESLHARPQGVRLETIVVDNASSDGACDMVAESFPEVTLIRNHANLGFSRANNQAASVARGRYLLFLNNDTEVPAGALQQLVAYAERHPEAGIIGPRLRDGDGRIQVSHRSKPTVPVLLHRSSLLRWTGLFRQAHHEYRRGTTDEPHPRRVDILMGAAMLLPREVYRSVGGWDESFVFGGEDMDLAVRVGLRYAVIYHPGVEVLHHGRVSTRLHSRFSSTNIPCGFVRYLRKAGSSEKAIILYKLVKTLDAPLQMAEKLVQSLWRRLQGRRAEARSSWLVARSLWHFLVFGLLNFWNA
jgi:GT2 family glycosyltransferase